ncbi:hypothetical protein YC2023_041071 [Brassica napus]
MSSQQLDDWFRSEAVSQNPTTCPSQKRCKDHELIVSAHHENVLKPRTSKQKQIFTWLKNVLLKPFREFFSLSCALKEIWCRKKHEAKLLKPKSHFDFVLDESADYKESVSDGNKQRTTTQHLCSWIMELEIHEENMFKTPRKFLSKFILQ